MGKDEQKVEGPPRANQEESREVFREGRSQPGPWSQAMKKGRGSKEEASCVQVLDSVMFWGCPWAGDWILQCEKARGLSSHSLSEKCMRVGSPRQWTVARGQGQRPLKTPASCRMSKKTAFDLGKSSANRVDGASRAAVG